MSHFKHTPAPWHAVEYAGRITLQVADEYAINDDLLDAESVGIEVLKANGRLAAAAPEMLAMLKNLGGLLFDEGYLKVALRVNALITEIEQP